MSRVLYTWRRDVLLEMSPDELLTTTRSVRKRLDLTRPVEREVLEECLTIAQQAPNASNEQTWHFVVVTDPEKRSTLADLYRRAWDIYESTLEAPHLTSSGPDHKARYERVNSSHRYLLEHLHEVPVHVIPCITGRTDNQPITVQSGRWGTIVPAAWSFMLAARTRGLGTCFTSTHLEFEEEAAKMLGIPYQEVMQTALILVAYTLGTNFSPAKREPLDTMVHWDKW